jgi:glycosyltransferase involved in cell wall biosynthesis
MRPVGLSAFVRCKNEEEYIVASLMSGYRVFDEIVVILNNSTDRTRELVEGLASGHPKIRLIEYPHECASIGTGYFQSVQDKPDSSLARYYNWCLEQTSFSHVCKWDGDMIATPVFEQVRALIPAADVVLFDGYDVLGQATTDYEARIFKHAPRRARYLDWDLYEVLEHDYSKIARVQEKCYLHMKLVKKEWLGRHWSSPNLLATRSVPQTGATRASPAAALKARARRIWRSVWPGGANGSQAGRQRKA